MQVTLLSSGVAQTISSVTSSSTTATVTTSAAHGYTTSNSVQITGVSPSGYNGTFVITVTSTTAFTYTLPASLSSVAGTTSQYYPYPIGEISVDGMYITVGSVNYPLQIINSIYEWEKLNAIQIQASALPQFYFPRRDDFGIWPTPQTVYTGKISYHYRDRNLSVVDYSTGTITATYGSNQIIGSGTTFTSAMVGRWITITDTTVGGQGYWYRITGFTDTTHVSIYQPWPNTTAAGATYNIGETPEIPEEGHILLVDGTTADFYTSLRKDLENGSLYENRFWTGDPNNSTREIGNSNIAAGLVGLMNRYSDRDDTHIINRKPNLNPLSTKIFATNLT